MERTEDNIVDNILVDDLVDVARFQGDADYVLKLVRKAVRANNVQQIHDLSRAIKAAPLMSAFNLHKIGRLALVDAVETSSQAAVHAVVTGFGLTAADVRSVAEAVGDPDLADCLGYELMLMEGTVDEDKRSRWLLEIWFGIVCVFITLVVCRAITMLFPQ